MHDFITLTKALADENRLRAIMALVDRELCVCQLIDLLGLAPSTVSKHMTLLRQARLILGRKQGRWMYYRLPGMEASPEVRGALDWVTKSLADHESVQKDIERLGEILKIPEDVRCGCRSNDGREDHRP